MCIAFVYYAEHELTPYPSIQWFGDVGQIVESYLACLWWVIEGIEMSLRQFRSWKAVHIRRGSNRAAHILAKLARGVDDCIVWVEDTPLVIDGPNSMSI